MSLHVLKHSFKHYPLVFQHDNLLNPFVSQITSYKTINPEIIDLLFTKDEFYINNLLNNASNLVKNFSMSLHSPERILQTLSMKHIIPKLKKCLQEGESLLSQNQRNNLTQMIETCERILNESSEDEADDQISTLNFDDINPCTLR